LRQKIRKKAYITLWKEEWFLETIQGGWLAIHTGRTRVQSDGSKDKVEYKSHLEMNA
jgi:hypothetical protein